jgi:hypothetical protein
MQRRTKKSEGPIVYTRMEQLMKSLPLSKKTVSLDFIDLVAQAELGASREIIYGQLQSPRHNSGIQTCFLLQPDSKGEYFLSRERAGEHSFLYAKLDEASKSFNIHRHKPGDLNFREDLPDFKLSFTQTHDRWSASVFYNSFVCEKCTYSRRERSHSISSISSSTSSTRKPQIGLIEISQGMEHLSTGQHWFHMTVNGRSTEFGDDLVECPECSENVDQRQTRHHNQSLEVHSIAPAVKNGDLKVKFITNNREILPSARNVQCASSKHNGDIVFQLVRVGDGVFNMDYKSPLSPLQAFFMTLATHYWI